MPQYTLATVALAAALLAGCSGSTPTSTAKAPTAKTPTPAAKSDIVTDVKPTPAQLAAYPLKTCPVSDEKLGEHGDPYVITYKGQLVQFCCDSCLDDFKKDPAKYMAMLQKSPAAAPSAPAATAK